MGGDEDQDCDMRLMSSLCLHSELRPLPDIAGHWEGQLRKGKAAAVIPAVGVSSDRARRGALVLLTSRSQLHTRRASCLHDVSPTLWLSSSSHPPPLAPLDRLSETVTGSHGCIRDHVTGQ